MVAQLHRTPPSLQVCTLLLPRVAQQPPGPGYSTVPRPGSTTRSGTTSESATRKETEPENADTRKKERGRESTTLPPRSSTVRRIGTGTGTMGREDTTATTTRDPAERKKRDTERRDTETKRRGDTSPQAVAAGGDMRVRRGTVIEDTNTRKSRGAERTRSPARNSLLTRRTSQSPQSDSLFLSPANMGTRCDPQAFCLTYQRLDCSSNIFQFTLKVKNPKHCFMYTLYTTCIF